MKKPRVECGAKTRQCRDCGHHRKEHHPRCAECKCGQFTPKLCVKSPLTGKTRCRNHGGATPSGPESANWRTGEYSKEMPTGLLASYDAALKNPALLSLRSHIAILDVRATQLLEQVGEHGSLATMKAIRTKLDQFKASGTKGKNAVGAARVALQELDDLVNAGIAAAETWEELHTTFELQRKLAETETKQMKDMHDMIATGVVIGMFTKFILMVKERVNDPKLLADLSNEWRRLGGGGDR